MPKPISILQNILICESINWPYIIRDLISSIWIKNFIWVCRILTLSHSMFSIDQNIKLVLFLLWNLQYYQEYLKLEELVHNFIQENNFDKIYIKISLISTEKNIWYRIQFVLILFNILFHIFFYWNFIV